VAFQPRGAVTPNYRRGGARITAGWKRCGVAGQPVNVADDDDVHPPTSIAAISLGSTVERGFWAAGGMMVQVKWVAASGGS